MTLHLSARLAWHDSGWDGRVCRNPLANVSCLVHEHIRDSRIDAEEVKHAGMALAGIDYRPPCSRDPGVYSPQGYQITHRDPLEWRNLPARHEDLRPYTVVTSPYGRMFAEEGGWELDPGRQLENLNGFFDELTPRRSLVFFYLKDGQPLVETSQRLIAGVGRIKRIGPQLYFGGTGDEHGCPYPIWSRAITQNFPSEGFRLPLQEYVQGGHDTSNILCLVPEGLTGAFSYVAEHVTDDGAITILERLIECLNNVKRDGIVKGDWDQHLAWLDSALGEVWHDRGPYPGISSILTFLGCSSAVAFQRDVLGPVSDSGKDPWVFTEEILEGDRDPVFLGHTKNLIEAASHWRSAPESRNDLLRLLARFDVTSDQVERIAHPIKRADAGIPFGEAEIVANPYLVAEHDLGSRDSEPVGFDRIDHGMLPAPSLSPGSFDVVKGDDDRRVRALLAAVLEEAAQAGDTILPLDEASRRAERYLAQERRCLPDPVRIEAAKDFFGQHLSIVDVPSGRLVSLKGTADDEKIVKERLTVMVTKAHKPAKVDWREIVDRILTGVDQLGSGDEEKAREEKIAALNQAFLSRLCVITGRAGTGKTTVARAFIEGIEAAEGKTSLLLLAPTGKARVRLEQITGREAKTVHQLLAENGWIRFERGFALKREGGEQTGAATILIDEASMIPIDLLATLFRSIAWNQVRRLVLMGDQNQLPPIGPGRPFADIVAWLDHDVRRSRLVRLRHRGRFHDANSLGLQLSDGYTSGDSLPADDEVLARVARGEVDGTDLEVHFWRDTIELDEIFHKRISALKLDGGDRGDFRALDASFRDSDGKPAPESWQILSPVRRHQVGTDEINRRIQLDYRKELIQRSRGRQYLGKRQLARPAGDHQIVWNDKVMQVQNEFRRSWMPGTTGDKRRYVANGEVGLVTWTEHTGGRDHLTTMFGTQPSVRFKYLGGEVDERLELAYAITVHKSQGSDFETVFLVLPREAAIYSRELIYTALTRFKTKLVLLLEQDIRVLEQFRRPQTSSTLARNSNLFTLALGPESAGFPYPKSLIHRTSKGILVRSKSEVIVADTLTRLGMDYIYEERLCAKDDQTDFRLPDFTVMYEGETWYWEHLGMLSVSSYSEAWDRKRTWYQRNGYFDQVITSEDGPDGSIDVPAIEQTIKERIQV